MKRRGKRRQGAVGSRGNQGPGRRVRDVPPTARANAVRKHRPEKEETVRATTGAGYSHQISLLETGSNCGQTRHRSDRIENGDARPKARCGRSDATRDARHHPNAQVTAIPSVAKYCLQRRRRKYPPRPSKAERPVAPWAPRTEAGQSCHTPVRASPQEGLRWSASPHQRARSCGRCRRLRAPRGASLPTLDICFFHPFAGFWLHPL